MESTLDSNGREMLAILYSLKSFKSLVQGKVVKLYTDSFFPCLYLFKVSCNIFLYSLPCNLYSACLRFLSINSTIALFVVLLVSYTYNRNVFYSAGRSEME